MAKMYVNMYIDTILFSRETEGVGTSGFAKNGRAR
jgi:hypothetical protein